MQADAGAQALQIFESWAEGLPEDQFQRLIIRPHTQIIEGLRHRGVTAPVIGFPRGAGVLIADYAANVPVQGVGLDTQTPLQFGLAVQATGKTIQGALDPLLLRQGGASLDARVESMLEAWSGGPYIFNLGHGILPDTPIDHVDRVVRRVIGQ
jgi:uroporphyrinogen decarboxylase